MSEYRDSHKFPSGLHFDYYTEIDKLYMEERNNIVSQNDLNIFINRWKYLFPLIIHNGITVEEFIRLRNDIDAQTEFVKQLKEGDTLGRAYMELLCPGLMMVLGMVSKQYDVTTGLVLIQMWNAGQFRELANGVWVYTPTENNHVHNPK